MQDSPADPPPFDRDEAAPDAPADPRQPGPRRVVLSSVEVEGLARIDAVYRSAVSSIIESRDENMSSRWREERNERGQIVAFVQEKGA